MVKVEQRLCLCGGPQQRRQSWTLYMMIHREVEARGIGNMMVGCVDIGSHGSWF